MSSGAIANLQSTLGGRLKEERIRLGHTQDSLARLANVTSRSVSAWEVGESTIRLDALYRLADVGIDIHYVIFGDGQDIGQVDPVLYQRVCDWAEVSCRDRRGKPLPDWEKHQRIARAYRWLASSSSVDEREARFAQLPASRVA